MPRRRMEGQWLELWTFRSQDFSFPGAKVPHGNFRSLELLLNK